MRYQSTYRKIAARALGRPLPHGAEVHHVNGNRNDNRPDNLVICQDAAYHDLLHARVRARRRENAGHAELTITDYTIRDAPTKLWTAVKVKAAQQGKPIRTVILELLEKWTEAKS